MSDGLRDTANMRASWLGGDIDKEQLIADLFQALVISLTPECSCCGVPLEMGPQEDNECTVCSDARNAIAKCDQIASQPMTRARLVLVKMGAKWRTQHSTPHRSSE